MFYLRTIVCYYPYERSSSILLSENERKVLDLINHDPFLSQAVIAKQLNLSRSTVAGIISSLIQKQYIQGRAYIVHPSSDIYCIGAMNVDRIYQLEEELILSTSNPVTSSVTIGGVARNIAENLGRLGQSVSLLSLAGNDADYQMIKEQSQAFVKFDQVKLISEAVTSSYTAILDPHGQMQVAFADMAICEAMNHHWIEEYTAILQTAQLLVADLNIQKNAAEALIQLAANNQIPLIMIPVSGPKMKHLPPQLKGISWLIVNQDESEAYFQQKVKNEADFIQLAQRWLERGVENILITRGTDTTLYANQEGKLEFYQPPINSKVVDVTGAGDSYAAGIIYGLAKGYPPQDAIYLGMANAYQTVQSPSTVRKDLNAQQLEQEAQQLYQNQNNQKERVK